MNRLLLPCLLVVTAGVAAGAGRRGPLFPGARSVRKPRSYAALEIRSKLGSIPAALTRLYGAESHAMAIFVGQQFLIEEVYGIKAAWPIDF